MAHNCFVHPLGPKLYWNAIPITELSKRKAKCAIGDPSLHVSSQSPEYATIIGDVVYFDSAIERFSAGIMLLECIKLGIIPGEHGQFAAYHASGQYL